ncbi:hypothetical protein [Saccharothrix variisporea]|uniref:Uncharacterized protein n=1 Tax=Saccharothrix variisporea TaxID=543527 RepID=A0A495XFT5_9PSEU|nr:hypothetical protein [Saccharothrix variisporea]RKT72882.1 hypothetical protein DFJ66_6206 [Saccharothrix variisporea]
MTYDFCRVSVKDLDVARTAEVLSGLGVVLEPQRSDRVRHGAFAGIPVEVRQNTDAQGPVADRWHEGQSIAQYQDPDDDFILWPVWVELGGDGDEDPGAMVELASAIMRAFWDRGHPAVAACDFEDELPWEGGIARLRQR